MSVSGKRLLTAVRNRSVQIIVHCGMSGMIRNNRPVWAVWSGGVKQIILEMGNRREDEDCVKAIDRRGRVSEGVR